MSDPNVNPDNTPAPSNEPDKGNKPEGGKDESLTPEQVAAIKQENERLKNADNELAKLKAEKEATEKSLKEKDMAATDLLKAREQELATIKRQALVNEARLKGGFHHAIFDNFTPTGETSEDIKASYESHKKSLDEYIAEVTKVSGLGSPTDNKTKTNEPSKKPVSMMDRFNIKLDKQA